MARPDRVVELNDGSKCKLYVQTIVLGLVTAGSGSFRLDG